METMRNSSTSLSIIGGISQPNPECGAFYRTNESVSPLPPKVIIQKFKK